MKNTWISLPVGQEVPRHGRHIVTCLINNGQRHVCLSYPGWSHGNNKVIAYMPIQPVIEDQAGWLSEYRGDDAPQEADWYIVTLQSRNDQGRRCHLAELWYDTKHDRWLAVPDKYEVVAYRPRPKPWKGNVAYAGDGLEEMYEP